MLISVNLTKLTGVPIGPSFPLGPGLPSVPGIPGGPGKPTQQNYLNNYYWKLKDIYFTRIKAEYTFQ